MNASKNLDYSKQKNLNICQKFPELLYQFLINFVNIHLGTGNKGCENTRVSVIIFQQVVQSTFILYSISVLLQYSVFYVAILILKKDQNIV